MADMRARDRVGRARYKTRLRPLNGWDALSDAYAEALDLAVYLRQALYERDGQRRLPVSSKTAPTPAMRKVIALAKKGKDLYDGTAGNINAIGARAVCIDAMKKRGLLNAKDKLTAKGKAVK